MSYEFPNIGDYSNQQVARATAALEAAGAWDTAPTELLCPTFDTMTLLLSYTRGAAGGGFEFRVELSLDGTVWYRSGRYEGAVVAAGVDTNSLFQREEFAYTSQGAAIERVTFGPFLMVGAFDNVRIPAHEIGAVGSPGELEIVAVFK